MTKSPTDALCIHVVKWRMTVLQQTQEPLFPLYLEKETKFHTHKGHEGPEGE
jgi:hypothetical protein